MSFAFDLEPDPQVPGPNGTTAAARARVRGYRRRRIAVLFSTLAVVLAVAVYVAAIVMHPLPASAATVPADAVASLHTEAVQPAWPASGSAAVGLVGQAGLLGSSGSDASVPIASMTKTITALVLLDKYQLKAGEQGPTITFGQSDVDILHQVWAEDGSWETVQAGEQLTLVQAMTAMILPSANNYARSLAAWSYGSQQAFVDAANAWLAKNGFTHTHMTDPSGLDSGSVSNLSDLVGIGELAVANPVLASVVSTKETTLPVIGDLKNSDPLIGQDGIEGIKTGYTPQAGHCLLFAAKVTLNGTTRTLVGVMLGQPEYTDLWSGVPKLLKSFEDGFHQLDLTDAGKTVYATYRTLWGSTTELVAATQPKADIFSSGTVDVSVDAKPLSTVGDGAKAGTVTFSYGGKTATSALTTAGAITEPGLWWKLTHPAKIL